MATDPVSFTRGRLAVSGGVAIQRAMEAIAGELPLVYQRLERVLALDAVPAGVLKQTNLTIAMRAQNAVVAGYRARLPRRTQWQEWQTGRLHGALADALDSDAMTSGTTDRVISFLNESAMGAEAVHWYRVNYGAFGPNLTLGRFTQPGAFPVAVAGKQTDLVLRDRSRPAPNSWLPRAWKWYGEGNSAAFEVRKGPGRARIGAGVRPARFTDLGLASVAKDFGPLYRQMYVSWGRSAAGRRKLAPMKLTVPANIRNTGS